MVRPSTSSANLKNWAYKHSHTHMGVVDFHTLKLSIYALTEDKNPCKEIQLIPV